MKKGVGSGSISQRYVSADPDPDPHQNVTDPQYWKILLSLRYLVLPLALLHARVPADGQLRDPAPPLLLRQRHGGLLLRLSAGGGSLRLRYGGGGLGLVLRQVCFFPFGGLDLAQEETVGGRFVLKHAG
jgi:hypothetical protein